MNNVVMLMEKVMHEVVVYRRRLLQVIDKKVCR